MTCRAHSSLDVLGLFTAMGVACSFGALDGFAGGESADAGVDAAGHDAAGGDAAAPFCTTLGAAPIACADFEDGQIPSRFVLTKVGATASASVDDQGNASKHAVVLAVGATAETADGACLRFKFATATTESTLAADVRMDAMGNGGFDLFTVQGAEAATSGCT